MRSLYGGVSINGVVTKNRIFSKKLVVWTCQPFADRDLAITRIRLPGTVYKRLKLGSCWLVQHTPPGTSTTAVQYSSTFWPNFFLSDAGKPIGHCNSPNINHCIPFVSHNYCIIRYWPIDRARGRSSR